MKTYSQIKHKENPFAYPLLPTGRKITLPEINGENLHLPFKSERSGGRSQMATFALAEGQPRTGSQKVSGGCACVRRKHGEGKRRRGGMELSALLSVCNAALPSPAIKTADKAWECVWASRTRNMP